MGLADYAQAGLLRQEIENRRGEFVFVLQDQFVNILHARVGAFLRVPEMMRVQIIEVVEYPGAGRDLGVLRPGRVEILGRVAGVEIMSLRGQLAGLLGWPQACFAAELDWDRGANTLVVAREVDDGVEKKKLPLPALVRVAEGRGPAPQARR